MRKKKECHDNVRINIDITESRLMMNKLLLIARLKLTKGPLYVANLIEIIKMAKKIFVSEIQQGKEVRIPDKMTIKWQDEHGQMLSDLPQSLRFYDFMYAICKSEVNEDKHKLLVTQLEKARSIAD